MKLKDEENAQVGETYLSCIWPSKHNIQITEKVTNTYKPARGNQRAHRKMGQSQRSNSQRRKCEGQRNTMPPRRDQEMPNRTEVRRKHCFPAIGLADVNEHGNVPAKMSEREFARCP